jgi:hypothetical protein
MKILKKDLKMLEEDLGILAVPLSLLALWLMGELNPNKNKGFRGIPGRPLPNDNVIQAINDMWENKPFVKDFAKILSDEGDLDELEKKLRTLKNSDKPTNLDYQEIWKMVNSTDFEPAPVAKKIVQRLLKTSSYKGIIRKYKLAKDDEQYFAKLLLLTIMRPQFTLRAKEWILKTLKPLPFLTRAGRDITAYWLTAPDAR